MREMKIQVPTEILKKIRPLLATYGGRKELAKLSGVKYEKLRDIKKHKLALPSVISALYKFKPNGHSKLESKI